MGIYSEFYDYMKNKKIYISNKLKADLGKDNWNDMLKEFVGYFTVSKNKGTAIDSLYDEMCSLFPYLLSDDIMNQSDQLLYTFDVLRKARIENKQSMEGVYETV